MTQASLEWGAQPDVAPENEVMVALDLETTGLDPANETIIEVGAVKFRGAERLASFSSLVNPYRPLSKFITELTGITQHDLQGAPSWSTIERDLGLFIGSHPMVGHRVAFDAGFLQSHGIPPKGRLIDTYDLASVLLPSAPDYSLGGLATRFDIQHDSPHRALSDALATWDIFTRFVDMLRAQDAGVLRALEELGRSSGWALADLASRTLRALPPESRRSMKSLAGVDRIELAKRLRVRTSAQETLVSGLQPHEIQGLFVPGGELSGRLPGYEYREEQARMSEAVSSAMDDGRHLLVEAGTGVGKSLAYLIPAALRALSGGGAVVVSTNTINLQEQIMNKDIPAAESVLEAIGIPAGTLKVAQLKGRANYLCFRRWAHAQAASEPDIETARVLGKCMVWLQSTMTGDRSEISLPRRESITFSRLSAQGAEGCPASEGPCFLRKARAEAHDAHIVVINHALLMSDIAMGGGLIPDHSALIIDEAHHLERVATRHLGFQVIQNQLESEVAGLGSDRGVLSEVARAVQLSGAEEAARAKIARRASDITAEIPRARRSIVEFYELLNSTAANLLSRSGQGREMRITRATRAQPGWSELEIAWENMDLLAGSVVDDLRELSQEFNEIIPRGDEHLEAIGLNLSASLELIGSAQAGLREAVSKPDDQMIYWLSVSQADGTTTVQGAPLEVGPILSDQLFARERCSILTGGTLTTDRGFSKLRDDLGLEHADELTLGSPFDFERSALVLVPEDTPEPGRPGYNQAMADAVREIAVATRDRMLVLFTSNSALYAAREALKDRLGADGIRVVAQGPDGTPRRIMSSLQKNQATVALGTSSLWEGVDLEAESIKTIVMPRLPFPVPTQPIFEARAEQYEDSFREYAVPEALIRFRQGFGRLIRKRSDRGAFVLLDRRVLSKAYGRRFLNALPACTMRTLPSRVLASHVREWLD